MPKEVEPNEMDDFRYSLIISHKKPLVGRRQWRWKLRDNSNGNTILASTEGYNNYSDLEHNLNQCRDYFRSVPSFNDRA